MCPYAGLVSEDESNIQQMLYSMLVDSSVSHGMSYIYSKNSEKLLLKAVKCLMLCLTWLPFGNVSSKNIALFPGTWERGYQKQDLQQT